MRIHGQTCWSVRPRSLSVYASTSQLPDPLRGPELRALHKLEGKRKSNAPYVFVSERKGPMTTAAFRRVIARAGVAAELVMAKLGSLLEK